MFDYKIVHQLPGRIKIHLPIIKGLSVEKLKLLADRLFADYELPDGIKKVRPNPITGNVVIEYDPNKIDIFLFLEELRLRMKDLDINSLLKN
ncbi:MAG: hypothetical protein LM575_01320 [Caldimicrobium sp.]|nr:hypothetical protein [Caldimicrobium sp.]MCC6048413.1 hypothetical protein [Thermodesulfobacterium sp.]